jgi:hypothetical protein
MSNPIKPTETVLPNGLIEVRSGRCSHRKLSAEAMQAMSSSPPAFAAQQYTLDTALDAIANLIAAATTLCPPNYALPTGAGPVPLDPSKIIEWMGDDLERTNVQGDQVIVYGFEDWKPDLYSGAGRLASLGELTIFISIWTRYNTDISGTNYWLFRAQSRGHWLRMFQVINAFSDQNLNTEYDENLTAIGTDLTVRPMMQVESKFANSKPKDPAWKISQLYFAVPIDKPILQPPTS